MPFFSFSVNQINTTLAKFNITTDNLYFSKNTKLWKILNNIDKSNINFLNQEKRIPVKNITKKILFCLPPGIGLGDSIEYASAIKKISENIDFDKLGVAFSGDYNFVFQNYFKLYNTYPNIINSKEIKKYCTIFHFTLEIKNLINQKYLRSNIYDEIINFFNVKDCQNNILKNDKINKINKISIFPISNSPIRTMPINILTKLIESLDKEYFIEIFLDQNSEVSNFILNNINIKNAVIVDPKSKLELITSIKKIEYGLFMDSGPLHVAKMFNKKGILLETTVSTKILLKNYNLIKGIENEYSSSYCSAPCGLTDIFNYKNKFGCYDSLKIDNIESKNQNFKHMINRGVKNNYLETFKKSVGCISSLNVQNIYNTIKKDLSICEES